MSKFRCVALQLSKIHRNQGTERPTHRYPKDCEATKATTTAGSSTATYANGRTCKTPLKSSSIVKKWTRPAPTPVKQMKFQPTYTKYPAISPSCPTKPFKMENLRSYGTNRTSVCVAMHMIGVSVKATGCTRRSAGLRSTQREKRPRVD